MPRPSEFAKRDGESDRNAERRRTTDIDAQYNAITCVALYMLCMTFSQKGIDRLRVHQEGMKMRDPECRLVVSEGFDDGKRLTLNLMLAFNVFFSRIEALSWFSGHFMKCSDRATLVKTWLPENSTEGPTWLGQLVYDRALQLVRHIALFVYSC